MLPEGPVLPLWPQENSCCPYIHHQAHASRKRDATQQDGRPLTNMLYALGLALALVCMLPDPYTPNRPYSQKRHCHVIASEPGNIGIALRCAPFLFFVNKSKVVIISPQVTVSPSWAFWASPLSPISRPRWRDWARAWGWGGRCCSPPSRSPTPNPRRRRRRPSV